MILKRFVFLLFSASILFIYNNSFSQRLIKKLYHDKETVRGEIKNPYTEEGISLMNKGINNIYPELFDPSNISTFIDKNDNLKELYLKYISKLIQFKIDNFEKEKIKLNEAYQEYLLNYYNNEVIKTQKSWHDAIEFYAISSWVSLSVVHLILIIGITSAIMEFYNAHKIRLNNAKLAFDTNERNVELKIQMDGIAIKSSFLGLIILVISIGLYFLYLKYVHILKIV